MEQKSNKAALPRLSDLAAGIKYEGTSHLPLAGRDVGDCDVGDGDQPVHVFLRGRRHPYAPPAVLESGSFECLALACSHLPMGQGNCHPAMVRS